MRVLKILLVAVLLVAPIMSAAGPNDIPGSADWYLHVDLKQMKSEDAGKPIYEWLNDEVFTEVKDEAGIDLAGPFPEVGFKVRTMRATVGEKFDHLDLVTREELFLAEQLVGV